MTFHLDSLNSKSLVQWIILLLFPVMDCYFFYKVLYSKNRWTKFLKKYLLALFLTLLCVVCVLLHAHYLEHLKITAGSSNPFAHLIVLYPGHCSPIHSCDFLWKSLPSLTSYFMYVCICLAWFWNILLQSWSLY